MAEYVLLLDDVRATLHVAGGKGASLARLAAAGLPVPGGYHVTTAAYRQFVDQNRLQERILAVLGSIDPAQPAALEAASQAIREMFSQGEIPPDVAGDISRRMRARTRPLFQSFSGEFYPPELLAEVEQHLKDYRAERSTSR